jgi:hypothetical protein
MTEAYGAFGIELARIGDPTVRDFAGFAFEALCPEDHWFWRAVHLADYCASRDILV